MASILDAGLAGLFSGIFVFLLVYTVVWGVLTWRKPFGDNKGAYALIAMTVAFLMAVAPPARAFITFIAPWYVALALVVFFILFITLLFGLSPDKDFPGIIKDTRVYAWLVILCVVVFVAGLAFTFGQTALAGGGFAGGQPRPPQQPGEVLGPGTPYQEPGTVVAGPYQGSGMPTAGQPGSTNTGDFVTNLVNTLIHPKVLGLLITFFIAAVAIYFLSQS